VRQAFSEHAVNRIERDAEPWRGLVEIAILMAMKRVSVAEAKNTLPALLHDAESAPVEIVRRGQPVAIILSRADYDRLRGKSEGLWASLQRFRETHDLETLDAASAFVGVRKKSTRGRPVRW
jgi:prevent-host-death family protein